METILAGHYQIVRHLGGGGFGQTFLASDRHLPGNPICVVKQLKPVLTDPSTLETAKRLFEQEAETLYQLGGHDQIPRLLAHFQQDQEFYLVQDYIEGDSLAQELVPGRPLSQTEVKGLLQDLLQVLSFVHQQHVIHRDIKPSNLIRRRRDRKVVLIDFGAVKEVRSQRGNLGGQTSFTVAIGSPGYMPSEQQSFRPQYSSDLYAIGMVCLQALSGVAPRDLPQDARGEYSCALIQGGESIQPELAAFLDRLVCYDYRQRYVDAHEALQAFQPLMEGLSNGVNDPTVVPTVLSAPLPPLAKTVLTAPSTASAELEEPEGQVSLQSRFYVERPPIEAECYEAITKPGALIRVKAPRQMGKTSLMTRILHYAAQEGCRSVPLYFQQADGDVFSKLDKFLEWFCASVAWELNLEDKLAAYWQGVLGSKNKCTNYFQRYLLPEIEHPLVLGLDEVDLLFQYPQIATDFFGLLRAWHERAKNEAIWQRLRLIIVHSKEVYIPLNINQSPFNVGLPTELMELTSAQVADLVSRHHLEWDAEQVEALMAMVGGHPYLIRVALYQIARHKMTLEELLHVAPTEAGLYGDHLRRHLLNLEADQELVDSICQVIGAEQAVRIDAGQAFKLRSMGLVKVQGNDVLPLCGLYRQYFRDRLTSQ